MANSAPVEIVGAWFLKIRRSFIEIRIMTNLGPSIIVVVAARKDLSLKKRKDQ